MENNELDFVNIPVSEDYSEDNIKHLEWNEHIRTRPGMYIGKAGDGSAHDDGIYILLKEIIDNCIDEYVMGFGKSIEISIADGTVKVRDYGRGIPLGSLRSCVGQMNTGGKYDSKAFKKSVGLNGVGTKAVNALSLEFVVQVWREDKTRRIAFKQGHLVEDSGIIDYTGNEKRGTMIEFVPDNSKGLFENYHFRNDFIETMMRNYAYLNTGLTLVYNGKKYTPEDMVFRILLFKLFVSDYVH